MSPISVQVRLGACTALAFLLCGSLAAQHHDKHDERALKEDPRLAEGQLAPVLEGLGDHHHEVTTASERAQMFFDQGLKLTYGFNHQEALRAFKEAARLDPDCAMAYWGWALVLGPNLNLPMSPEVVPQAHASIGMALDRKDKVTAKERGMIEALAKLYVDDAEADRAPLNAAYADAMGKLHAEYPEDNDIATLYGAALMNLSPWDYWNRDGSPKGNTTTVTDVLEGVMARDPKHEGALHYYIHIVESVDAMRGKQAADALRGLAPGAGHLVHMPSHIYMQLGRFGDSYDDNILAAKADLGYITQCRTQGIYPLTYYPHNIHFVVWAAMMQGRSAEAIAAARKVAAQVPADMHDNVWGLYQAFLSMPLTALVRFGKWEEILKEPQPPETTIYLAGFSHFARGLAFLRTGQSRKAVEEYDKLNSIAANPASRETTIGFSHSGTLLTIATEILVGEINAGTQRWDSAIGHMTRASLLQDSLLYNEPPDFLLSARHYLGAVLLEAGLPVEAEIVFWQDLQKHRENGYALYGLWKTLERQGKTEAAAEMERRFREAWGDADLELPSSRF